MARNIIIIHIEADLYDWLYGGIANTRTSLGMVVAAMISVSGRLLQDPYDRAFAEAVCTDTHDSVRVLGITVDSSMTNRDVAEQLLLTYPIMELWEHCDDDSILVFDSVSALSAWQQRMEIYRQDGYYTGNLRDEQWIRAMQSETK